MSSYVYFDDYSINSDNNILLRIFTNQYNMIFYILNTIETMEHNINWLHTCAQITFQVTKAIFVFF